MASAFSPLLLTTPGLCTAAIDPGTASATDNCGAPTVAGVRSDGAALNAPYPKGVTTITWAATDASGNQVSCPQTITVNDLEKPTITSITGPVGPLALGSIASLTVTFTDNCPGPYSVKFSWDDGSPLQTVGTSSTSVPVSHTYGAAGVYSVTVTVCDASGNSATTLYQFIVIYDPSGGFVTGGGWINSPAGAYAADPTLSGKATFGFVSKCLKGANVPTGNTEFQFHAGSLNFSSTSYQWLVIAGARAQYKGWGTINGAGSYKFLLTATDGQVNGGGGTDKFRIKITDGSGTAIYDNAAGPDDIDTSNQQTLGGGSIVIHK